MPASTCAPFDLPETLNVPLQMHYFLLMNKQGKVRLAKWFSTYTQKERTRVTKEVASLVLPRDSQVRLSLALWMMLQYVR